MKRFLLLICYVSLAFTLSAEWLDIRRSAVTSDGDVKLRFENSVSSIALNQVKYLNNGEWSALDTDEYQTGSYQTAISFTNQTPLPLSFRLEAGNGVSVIPGYTDQEPATLNSMTRLSEYERNTGVTNHLNIAAERMLFSEEKLYFALKNFGGGFPLNNTFFTRVYSYTINLWPKTQGIPNYVYSLLYTVDLGSTISPGLYRINSATEELTKIGEVVTQVDGANNTLYISCLLSDLVEDQFFSENYYEGAPLTVAAITQQIAPLTQTVTITDEGNLHTVYLRDTTLHPQENTLPLLEDIVFIELDGTTTLSLDYFDSEQNFPLVAEIVIDSAETYYLTNSDNDFTNRVGYSVEFTGEWSNALIRFSDNNSDFVEHFIDKYQPKAPENLALQIDGETLTISWDAVVESVYNIPLTPSSYRIYKAGVSPFADDFVLLEEITETFYTRQIDLESSTREFFRVKAIIDNE